jgi:hypothetical protein|tara:strand:- start:5643 stop:6659 length:1017 start_codon:yes stop_codon:yes gene_type:complete
MRELKNKLTTGKNTKNTQQRKAKSFGYQVLGFGAGGGGASFICATGGTTSTDGDYKIHTFTSPGTFCVAKVAACAAENVVSYMVVAGGAGGGRGGGGGAGGFREFKNSCDGYTASPLNGNPGGTSVTVCAQGYPITVGAGGTAGVPNSTVGPNGANSVFSTVTSAGGGGSGSGPSAKNAADGGSGGGGGGPAGSAGSGNTPPVSPPQGNNGSGGTPCNGYGGGGGATNSPQEANTQPGPSSAGGFGGDGASTGINPSTCVGTDGPTPGRWFAGGGQGAPANTPTARGGRGGGGWWEPLGTPRCSVDTTHRNGKANTGGGAGAEYAGGSGIVIIRYKSA